MTKKQKKFEELLVRGLTTILRRTVKLDHRDQLAIAQEYKEWINCISANDFEKQEILVLDKKIFR